MENNNDVRIAWIDVETNGVDARPKHNGKLFQVAAIITDGDFNELDVIETTFYFPETEAAKLRALANPYVQKMHDATDLWKNLSNLENQSYENFDNIFARWLQKHEPEPNKLVMGGNSITLDREFLREFLPKSFACLSYQSLDMSSIQRFFELIEGRPEFEKKKTHAALDDIRESIAQARWHRDYVKAA